MELRLPNRSRDFRFIRPKRAVWLESLRALWHNLSCEYIRLVDSGHARWQSFRPLMRQWRSFSWVHRLGEQLRRQLSGQAAAFHIKKWGQSPWSWPTIERSFWPFIFALGLLIGVGAKILAQSSFTIGYEDYTLPRTPQYDLNQVERSVMTKSQETPPTAGLVYPGCPAR